MEVDECAQGMMRNRGCRLAKRGVLGLESGEEVVEMEVEVEVEVVEEI